MVFVSITNADGLEGVLSGSCDAEWISNIKENYSGTGLTFSVTDNNENTERTATMTVYYTWNGYHVSTQIEIVQDVKPA